MGDRAWPCFWGAGRHGWLSPPGMTSAPSVMPARGREASEIVSYRNPDTSEYARTVVPTGILLIGPTSSLVSDIARERVRLALRWQFTNKVAELVVFGVHSRVAAWRAEIKSYCRSVSAATVRQGQEGGGRTARGTRMPKKGSTKCETTLSLRQERGRPFGHKARFLLLATREDGRGARRVQRIELAAANAYGAAPSSPCTLLVLRL